MCYFSTSFRDLIIQQIDIFVKTLYDLAMKIIHFADVHLGMENYGKFDPETGLNSRLADFLNSFETIVATAKKEKVDLVCFAGDAFKTREPNPTYQKAFASKIYELACADIPVAMLVGNHDFPGALGKAHTLEIYPTLNIKNVYMIGDEARLPDGQVKTIQTKSGPIQIAGLPWYTKQQLLTKNDLKLPLEKMRQKLSRALAAKVEYLSSKIDPKIPSILLAHAAVEGATFGSERSVMIGSDIILPLASLRHSRFNYVALGHIHKHQKLSKNLPRRQAGPPIVYAGSIERIDFGEEKEDKGFILLDIMANKRHKFQTNWQFIKTPARKFLTIHVKIADDDDTDEKISQAIRKENIREAVVKVVIEINEAKAAEISESKIRTALEEANFIAGIIKEVKSHERTQIKNGFSDELASLDTLGILEKYLQSKKVSKSHKQELLKTAEKLIEETQ